MPKYELTIKASVDDKVNELQEIKDAINGSAYKVILWTIREKLIRLFNNKESINGITPEGAQELLRYLNDELESWDINID